MKELIKQLSQVQQQLKAPKGQFNSFGKYKYRNCEDILEAVKPLLGENIVLLDDDVVNIGDRYYVKATAIFTDGENEKKVTAYARESEDKKGMDDSQMTGTASSYARKYALNGLFLIDDTKDADTDSFTEQKNEKFEAFKKQVDAIKDKDTLRTFYENHKGQGKEFDAYVISKGKAL